MRGREAECEKFYAEEDRRREVLCTDGDIDYKADLMNRKLSSTKNNEIKSFDFTDAMMDELTAFVETIRNNRIYLINASVGCNTVEIAEEIEKEILKSLFK